MVRRQRHMVEVNDEDISLSARGQTSQVLALDEFAAGNSGRVEDVMRAPGLKIPPRPASARPPSAFQR
jgi:hypothetical protein